MTQDDSEVGLVRADGRTPRSAYDWLKMSDPNAALFRQKERVVDVEAFVTDDMVPVGYQDDSAWRQPWMVHQGRAGRHPGADRHQAPTGPETP